MPILNKFELAPYPEHPGRCQSSDQRTGQCLFLGVPKADGSLLPNGEIAREKHCWRHGGNKALAKEESKNFRLYQIVKWKEKLGRMADSPKVKDLREDIGVLRMTLETKLESIKDDMDLILNSQQLITIIREIKETVIACNKIELSNGQMLDKNQAQAFIQDIIEILTNYVADTDILQMISEDMSAAYDRLTGQAVPS